MEHFRCTQTGDSDEYSPPPCPEYVPNSQHIYQYSQTQPGALHTGEESLSRLYNSESIEGSEPDLDSLRTYFDPQMRAQQNLRGHQRRPIQCSVCFHDDAYECGCLYVPLAPRRSGSPGLGSEFGSGYSLNQDRFQQHHQQGLGGNHRGGLTRTGIQHPSRAQTIQNPGMLHGIQHPNMTRGIQYPDMGREVQVPGLAHAIRGGGYPPPAMYRSVVPAPQMRGDHRMRIRDPRGGTVMYREDSIGSGAENFESYGAGRYAGPQYSLYESEDGRGSLPPDFDHPCRYHYHRY
ncbi:hypothetical protein TWF694_000351 [Orbilia ellipsospora]|uniref:Uncharacterized protein n=1 Tax=Orbilia ellipsospora TaxID=2528407 RepID=A0AAV9XNB5_9PEZI